MEIQDIFYVQIAFIVLTFIILFRLLNSDSRAEEKLNELRSKSKIGKDKE